MPDIWSFAIVVVANMFNTEAMVPPLAPPTMKDDYGHDGHTNDYRSNYHIHRYVYVLTN